MRQPEIPTTTCPYCGGSSKLVDSREIYGRSYGLVWHCRPCDAYVGVHKDSPTHAPLGSLANRDTRAWRVRAHDAFDPLWKRGRVSRSDAYKMLADKLRISPARTHISWLDVEGCKEVVRAAKEIATEIERAAESGGILVGSRGARGAS